MPSNSFLRREEVMALLKVKKSTLHRYLRKGFLPYYKIGEGKGGRILIKKTDLDSFLESRRIHRKPNKKSKKPIG